MCVCVSFHVCLNLIYTCMCKDYICVCVCVFVSVILYVHQDDISVCKCDK